MSKRVGIPRGLAFYNYYPLWRSFFEELGAEIIVSDYSTKKTLDEGIKSCVDEACLPVKLFHGHVLNLKDRVDFMFIPRLTSVSRNEYICPKFGGLPDMIRHSIKDLPKIIDTEVDLRKSKNNALKSAFEVGSFFDCSKHEIEIAFRKALREYSIYKNKIRAGELACDLLDKRSKDKSTENIREAEKRLNIALIGHEYNINDNLINMNLINKLRRNNINLVTVETVESKIITEKISILPKKIFWNFGSKAVGCALHLLERTDIDGIIYIMTFGCGVDSFICDLIERRIRRESDIPFTVLTIDEHSGEAGMDTRLEAFIDMIRWRKRDESNVPTYG
jgi:predicted nucleotide-binding protein (sugar kinase/HSP70/actin superfamily)